MPNSKCEYIRLYIQNISIYIGKYNIHLHTPTGIVHTFVDTKHIIYKHITIFAIKSTAIKNSTT